MGPCICSNIHTSVFLIGDISSIQVEDFLVDICDDLQKCDVYGQL